MKMEQIINTRTQTSRIQTTHDSERLKLVFLEAITHDFKSPLTSIKASVAALLGNLETDREQRKELPITIDDERDRINQLVNEASETARLESGKMNLDIASHPVEELISAALADCKRPNSRLLVDSSLANRALARLVTNAQLSRCGPCTARLHVHLQLASGN